MLHLASVTWFLSPANYRPLLALTLELNMELTTGPASILAKMLTHQLRELANRNLIPHRRIGKLYIFNESDIPLIRQKAIETGFIKDDLPLVSAV